MGDSELPASQLRQRYLRGGSARDDELSAAQLRARHGIPTNSKDFATGSAQDTSSGSFVIIVIGVVLLLGIAAFIFKDKFGN